MLSDVISQYLTSIQKRMTWKNQQKIRSVLRQIFGPICPELIKKLSTETKGSTENRPTINVRHIQDITSEEIDNFLTSMIKNEAGSGYISKTTANRYRERIRALISWAMTVKKVPMPGDLNPTCSITKFDEDELPCRFMTLSEIRKQLLALHNNIQLFAMVAMMIFAGLRREEILWLRTEDVDLKDRKIHVRNKKINGVYWRPKNKNNRVVPISKLLTRILEMYVRRRNISKGWYFPSPEGCKWDADNFSGCLKDINNSREFNWTCLDFRHTFGSHLAMKNISLYKISKLMGNSPDICRKHYAHLMVGEMHDDVEF
ncbi:MAG: hypothetical protein A2076_06650 [Geobacteraceae bacterium GWC2_53_11]|nr:MAG: hypothetical protein A2076_06650 [Geobacteraceae bacterium GWC2_53_11]